MTTEKKTITIDGYQIDASISEEHTFESEISEYPVETGSNIADNVRPKPIVVKIEGVVSDTPIGRMADVRNNQGDNGQLDFTPSNDAYARLKLIHDTSKLVTIETTLGTFDNMACSNLEVPRDAQTGYALRFTATFQQVILVTNLRTTIRVAAPALGKKDNRGTAAAKHVDTARVRVLDHHGTAVEGVHWDEQKKKYLDKDGFTVFDESENYQLDPASGRYLDRDTGLPVTEAGAKNPGSIGNRGAPWWSNWGYLPDN